VCIGQNSLASLAVMLGISGCLLKTSIKRRMQGKDAVLVSLQVSINGTIKL
jgi:hypothetical protein